MPIYKFRCQNEECDHITEFLHLAKIQPDGKVGSDPCPESATCEECSGPTARVFEAPGLARISYERNGRKAIEIRQDGKKTRTTSATREKYEHDAGNVSSSKLAELRKQGTGFQAESVYSKSVQKVLDQKRLEKEKKKC